MSTNQRYEEKIDGADVEENETRFSSPPNGIDVEDRVAHIHAKTVILVLVGGQIPLLIRLAKCK